MPVSPSVPDMEGIFICHWGAWRRGPSLTDVYSLPLVEFMYLVFTCMPGESYRKRLGSLFLCLCDVLWLIGSPMSF